MSMGCSVIFTFHSAVSRLLVKSGMQRRALRVGSGRAQWTMRRNQESFRVPFLSQHHPKSFSICSKRVLTRSAPYPASKPQGLQGRSGDQQDTLATTTRRPDTRAKQTTSSGTGSSGNLSLIRHPARRPHVMCYDS